MAKRSSSYVCQSCGAVAQKWTGKCVACEGWNTLVEESDVGTGTAPGVPEAKTRGKSLAMETLAATADEAPRMPTGLAELDRVTGGGLVPG